MPPARDTRLRRSLRSRLTACTCVPAVLVHHGTGISTCCPSATRPRLALGPDLPRADQLYPGTLGYSARGIPTPVSLLIPAFSLPGTPRVLTVTLRRACNAPLPVHLNAPLSFGGVFQPRTFSARDLSASELLRTLSMLGCFWANILAVSEVPHPFPLNTHFGTLAVGLGSFPLDRPTYLVRSDSRASSSMAFGV